MKYKTPFRAEQMTESTWLVLDDSDEIVAEFEVWASESYGDTPEEVEKERQLAKTKAERYASYLNDFAEEDIPYG